jgi:predicted amidophosphoribosyltransferase
MNVLRELIALLAPPGCVGCGRALAGADARLCPECVRALPWLRRGCPRCGLPKHRGRRCPAAHAAFPRSWAPMAYQGVARRLVAALKFRGALPVADVMAAHMAANLPSDLRGRLAPRGEPAAPRVAAVGGGPAGARVAAVGGGRAAPREAAVGGGPAGARVAAAGGGRAAPREAAVGGGPAGAREAAAASGGPAAAPEAAARRDLAEAREAGAGEGVALVPVPAAPVRRRGRGFDPAHVLTVALARRLDQPVADCLVRRDRAARQVGASRRERRAPGRLVIHVRGSPPALAILVDDVHTTGATLDASARALAAAGTRVVAAITYARTL